MSAHSGSCVRPGIAAVFVLAVVCGGAWAAPPLDLVQPQTGKAVRVDKGAAALHLVLFATWCEPCREELERLTVLEERWREHGYRLVLIAVPTRHTPERLVRFVKEQSPPGELLFDPEGQAQARLQADGLPTHILIDKAGRELVRSDRLSSRIDDALEQLFLGGER